MFDDKKNYIPYATHIPTVIINWFNDPIIPVIYNGDIDVKYEGIIDDDIPQNIPNKNRDMYIYNNYKLYVCNNIPIFIKYYTYQHYHINKYHTISLSYPIY